MAWGYLLLEKSLAPQSVADEVFWELHWWKRGCLSSCMGLFCVLNVEELTWGHFALFLRGPPWRVMGLQWREHIYEVKQNKSKGHPEKKYATPGSCLSDSPKRCPLEMKSVFPCAKPLAGSQHRTRPACSKSLCPSPSPFPLLDREETWDNHGVRGQVRDKKKEQPGKEKTEVLFLCFLLEKVNRCD